MGNFNKEKFAELLSLAKGSERSINQYGLHSDISPAHISRLLRGKLDTPPSPETIKKLADKAHNGVTYQDLMEAAGHLGELNLGFGSIDDKENNTPEIPELPGNLPFKVTSRDKKQYKDFMERAGKDFFYNDEIAVDEKQEMLNLYMEMFIDAKKVTKEKYGRKKKPESEVVEDGGNA